MVILARVHLSKIRTTAWPIPLDIPPKLTEKVQLGIDTKKNLSSGQFGDQLLIHINFSCDYLLILMKGNQRQSLFGHKISKIWQSLITLSM